MGIRSFLFAAIILFGLFWLLPENSHPPPSSLLPDVAKEPNPTKSAVQPAVLPKQLQTTAEKSHTQIAPETLDVSYDIRALAIDLTNRTQIAILIDDSIPMSEKVSLPKYKKQPYEEYLKRMVEGYESIWRYDSSRNDKLPAQIWVYARGRLDARAAPYTQENDDQSITSSISTTQEDNAKSEGERLAILIANRGKQAEAEYLSALDNPSEEVRQRTIFALNEEEIAIPTDKLYQLSLSDPDATIRQAAFFNYLQANQEDLEAYRMLAEQLLADQSEQIRNQAKAVLANINTSSTTREQKQQ